MVINLYHLDKVTGFLNTTVLLQADVPIYHAGVEVFGKEWSFQYNDATWNNPSVSGLRGNKPKSAGGYEFVKSINLGPTSFVEIEVAAILSDLRYKWSACEYHITHKNCVTFAEHFVSVLKPPFPFPPSLKGIHDASRSSPSTDAIVNFGWDWAKWVMEWQNGPTIASQ